jgi:hypothetical protein
MNVNDQFVRIALASAIIGGAVFSGLTNTTPTPTWNNAAANYLDTREVWWQSWRPAQRDHGTVCISCHTVVPYALARPALRGQNDNTLAIPERIMFNNIVKRVTLWNDVEPFYKDSPSDPTKSTESRGTEAVLNALILASYDARRNHLTDITRTAFNHAWALQQQSGDKAGAWIWLNFHNAPWESNESEYHGAALAALAVGIAPDNYRDDPKIQPNLELLRAYLRREYHTQPLVNRLVLLWASAKLPGLLTPPESAELIKTVLTHQQPDGGWSLTDLGTWKRRDNTPLETKSDGYATGLTVLALEENGQQHLLQTTQGIAWLRHNQDPNDGLWPAWSLNKKREPTSDIYHFMDDASTAYAVLALEQAPK